MSGPFDDEITHVDALDSCPTGETLLQERRGGEELVDAARFCVQVFGSDWPSRVAAFTRGYKQEITQLEKRLRTISDVKESLSVKLQSAENDRATSLEQVRRHQEHTRRITQEKSELEAKLDRLKHEHDSKQYESEQLRKELEILHADLNGARKKVRDELLTRVSLAFPQIPFLPLLDTYDDSILSRVAWALICCIPELPQPGNPRDAWMNVHRVEALSRRFLAQIAGIFLTNRADLLTKAADHLSNFWPNCQFRNVEQQQFNGQYHQTFDGKPPTRSSQGIKTMMSFLVLNGQQVTYKAVVVLEP